jgi:predicted TIM-barrel fold metal-dependent hydrolase
VQAACVHVEAIVGVHASTGDVDPVAETVALGREGIDVPYALVPHVSFQFGDAAEVLDKHLAASDHVRGVRMIVNFLEGNADATYPTVTHEYLTDPVYAENILLLRDRRLVYDIHLTPEQLLRASRIIASLGDSPVVIDHMACPRFHRKGESDEAMWATWREGMRACAALPNAFVKLSAAPFPCSVRGLLVWWWARIVGGLVLVVGSYWWARIGGLRCVSPSISPVRFSLHMIHRACRTSTPTPSLAPSSGSSCARRSSSSASTAAWYVVVALFLPPQHTTSAPPKRHFPLSMLQFASNFPVDRMVCGVTLPELYAFFFACVEDFSAEDKDKLFYANAVRVYRIPGADTPSPASP